ncbi:MAG: hypothetical protein K2X86_04910, partial [Cytophagaceae bacterium]|nr:hypothetical protein [Cytophagaceae bacterium]
MSQIKNFTRKFIKGTLKFILYTFVILLLLLGGIIIALQFPSVQTRAANKAASYLSETLGFPIAVETVDIDWFDEVVLEGVSVHDPQKGKMIYLKEAVVDFEITSFYKAKFNIDEIILRNGRVNMVKYSDGTLNMTEFIEAIRNMSAPPKDKKRKPVPFTLDEVKLDNMYYS